MNRFERNLTILYGSETGNAQDVAERIWNDCRRRHISAWVSSANEFDITKLTSTHILIFVCSTTGQGIHPTNVAEFWNKLRRKSLPQNCMSQVHFAVLGLGDSSYSEFNFAAKKLYRRFEQLGAQSICDLELADDQHELGLWFTVDPWIKELWNRLEEIMVESDREYIAYDAVLEPRYKVVFMKSKPNSEDKERHAMSSTEVNPYIDAKIVANVRVTAADHFQDTRLIDVDISETGIQYSPGDVAQIVPQNLQESVHLAIDLLGLKDVLQDEFVLEPQIDGIQVPPSYYLPRPCTVLQCLKQYWDLQCIPRQSFFLQLAGFSKDEMEKERLEQFCSAEGTEELYSYCNRQRRTIVEVLQDFSKSACSVPLAHLFDLLPTIRPRSFSIASSQLRNRDRLQLLVAVVRYKTRLVKPRLGLCSNWLARLKVGQTVPMRVVEGTFKFPKNNSYPMLLFGPGTGIAPFRSYLWQLALNSNEIGFRIQLYFGCRNKLKDFYFEQEWIELKKFFGERFQIFGAFSRDQEKKIYVQHLIKKNNCFVQDLLNYKCHILIAGNAKDMPDDVLQTIQELLEENGLNDKNYIDKMKKFGRIQMETWN